MTDSIDSLYGLEGSASPLPQSPDPIESAAQQHEQDQVMQGIPFSALFSRSVGLDHAVTNQRDLDTYTHLPDDASWELPEGFMDEVLEAGIPAEWASEFAESRSQDQFDAMLRLYARRAEDEEFLGQAGGWGTTARVAASFTDPVGAGVDAVASLAGGAGIANRFRRIVAAAGAAGVSNTVVGSLQRRVDPTYSANDAVTDFALGGTLGIMFEGLGAFASASERAAMSQELNAAKRRMLGEKSAHGDPVAVDSDFDEVVTRTPIEEEVDDPDFFARREELMALSDGAPNDDAIRTTSLELKRATKDAEDLKARLTPEAQEAERIALTEEFLKEDIAVHGDRPASSKRLTKERSRAVEAHLKERTEAAKKELEDAALRLERLTGESERMAKSAEALTELRRMERIEKRGEVPKVKRVVREDVAVTRVPRTPPTSPASTPSTTPRSGSDDSMGAARVRGSTVSDDILPDDRMRGTPQRQQWAQEAEQEAGLGTRTPALKGLGTLAGIGRNSRSVMGRWLDRKLFADPVQATEEVVDAAGNITHVPTVNRHSAEDYVAVSRRHHQADFYANYDGIIKDFYQRQQGKFKGAIKSWMSPEARMTFNRRVGKVLQGFDDLDPAVRRAADLFRRKMSDLYDGAAKAGAKGFDASSKLADYMTRMPRRGLDVFLRDRLRGAESMNGVVEELLTRGISQGRLAQGLKVDAALTRRVARVYADRMLYKAISPNALEANRIDLDYLDELLDSTGMPANEKDEILNYFEVKQAAKEGAPSARLKHRLPLDLTVTVPVGDGSSLSLAELFEDDIEHLFNRYNSHATGMEALARTGFDDHREVRKLYEDLYAQGELTDAEFRAKDLGYRHIMGLPMADSLGSETSRNLRLVRGWNFTTMLNQVFWSMFAETAGVVANAGGRAALRVIPQLGKLAKAVASGTADSTLIRQLRMMGSPGTATIRHSVSNRAEDWGVDGIGGHWLRRKLENFGYSMQKFTATVSGLGPLNDMQQMVLSHTFADYLVSISKGTRQMTDAEAERLLDYGLAREDFGKLFGHMNQHAKYGEAGELVDFGVDNLDPEMHRKLQLAFYRAQAQWILEPNVGATFPWMHKELSQVAFQFRGFSLNALHRRTIHGLARRDATAGIAAIGGMTIAYLAQMGRTVANYSPEDERYQKVMGDPLQLMKTAFAATTEASVIPMVVDTAMSAAGRDPFFNNYNRTSGNASSFLEGIPSVALVTKGMKAATIIPDMIFDDRLVSKTDIQALTGLVPLNNALGALRFNRWLASQFPSEMEVRNHEQLYETLDP